jgi:beta-lactamase superfamily II metal-dependent hydrolase
MPQAWRWRTPVALGGLLAIFVLLAGPADASALPSDHAATAAAGAPAAQTFAAQPARVADGAFEVHFIDVGQGNATLVIAPSGKTILVDSGEAYAAAKVATYLDQVLGRRSVDYFVVSHYHADHFGSFVPLVRDYGLTVTTATYDRGGDIYEYNSALYRNYFDYCTVQDPLACKRTTIHEGDPIDLGLGATASVICAGDIVIRVSCGETIRSENDNSILIVVSSGSLSVWIGGDTSGDVSHRYYADVETAAVNLGRVGPWLDVYGVDHHGSCYSTNGNLVNATWPTVSVFSLGRNSYGHPCAAVVDRLAAAWSDIYSTEDSNGGVVDGDVRVTYVGGTMYTVSSLRGVITYNTKT